MRCGGNCKRGKDDPLVGLESNQHRQPKKYAQEKGAKSEKEKWKGVLRARGSTRAKLISQRKTLWVLESEVPGGRMSA